MHVVRALPRNSGWFLDQQQNRRLSLSLLEFFSGRRLGNGLSVFFCLFIVAARFVLFQIIFDFLLVIFQISKASSQAEISNSDTSVPVHQNIPRLEVPMHDVCAVDVLHPAQNLVQNLADLLVREVIGGLGEPAQVANDGLYLDGALRAVLRLQLQVRKSFGLPLEPVRELEARAGRGCVVPGPVGGGLRAVPAKPVQD